MIAARRQRYVIANCERRISVSPLAPAQTFMSPRVLDRAMGGFEEMYTEGTPPWDSGRPQRECVRLRVADRVDPCGAVRGAHRRRRERSPGLAREDRAVM